jgi:hypothetical protein
MKAALMFLILIFANIYLHAQTTAVTTDGKKVILHSDSTWEFLPEAITNVGSLNCSDLIVKDTDKMTGQTSVGSAETLIISEDGGKTGFGIYIIGGSKSSLIFQITAVGAGNCIDDEDKMNLLFRDGTRLELVNNGKFNCKGNFTLYFGGVFGQKVALLKLKTTEIETMRVWTSDSYLERDFTALQSAELVKTIKCILEASLE